MKKITIFSSFGFFSSLVSRVVFIFSARKVFIRKLEWGNKIRLLWVITFHIRSIFNEIEFGVVFSLFPYQTKIPQVHQRTKKSFEQFHWNELSKRNGAAKTLFWWHLDERTLLVIPFEPSVSVVLIKWTKFNWKEKELVFPCLIRYKHFFFSK